MGRVEVSTKIKAPVEEVWDFLWDFEKVPKWILQYKKIEITSGQTHGVVRLHSPIVENEA